MTVPLLHGTKAAASRTLGVGRGAEATLPMQWRTSGVQARAMAEAQCGHCCASRGVNGDRLCRLVTIKTPKVIKSVRVILILNDSLSSNDLLRVI